MRISKHLSCRHKTLLIICLLVGTTCVCSAQARASQAQDLQKPEECLPDRGLKIMQVHEGSSAQRAGLKPKDILFRYGDFEIVDRASFFVARDAFEDGRKGDTQIVVCRQRKLVRITVEAGQLGIESNEYGPVAYELMSLMMQLDRQLEIPEFMLQREYKASYVPLEKVIDEATRLIDRAERESTLTPAQILVARIYMILDDASPEDLKRQSELLAKLVATQPMSYVLVLGQNHFFKNKRYRAAVECFKHYLEVNPDDVAIRLNLGVAYSKLRMFAEAEAITDYVLDHQRGLGDHGYTVIYEMKAMAALNRGDYSKSLMFAEKAFDLEQRHFDIFAVLLAAAQSGDMKKLAEASSKFQRTLPSEFEKKKLHLAAVEALALVKSNQRDRARELTQKWKDTDRIEGGLKAYWEVYPGGSDIWNNWNDLTRN